MSSLYIHIPFCFHKCHYCDFYSIVDQHDRQADFVRLLIQEIRALAPHAAPGALAHPLRTIFVGGGTPSLLRVDLWVELLDALHASFDLSLFRQSSTSEAEFTVECNPETVTPELMSVLREGGVSRISIGAQSFRHSHLKTLERWHDPENVSRAISLAHDAGIHRRSIDLIYAIPGQTIADLNADLDRALALQPEIEHVSCYALTYEPNTAMTRRLHRGEFEPTDERLEVEMADLILARFREAGFERYEVSNYAKPGAESMHNLAYWRQEQWLAAGPSASAHVGGRRWKNVPRLTEWMIGVEQNAGFSPILDFEEADPRRFLAEKIMMGIRLREGISAAAVFQLLQPIGPEQPMREAVAKLEKQRLLSVAEDRWTLTDRGFHFADGVASELMAAISG